MLEIWSGMEKGLLGMACSSKNRKQKVLPIRTTSTHKFCDVWQSNVDVIQQHRLQGLERW
jgi:hypothetical protein